MTGSSISATALVLVAVLACEKRDSPAAQARVWQPAQIVGPSVAPTITDAITFVVPKDATAWGELAWPCVTSALEAGHAGSTRSVLGASLDNEVGLALDAAGVDPDRDFAAVGAWVDGESVTMYVALALAHPDQLATALRKSIAGVRIVPIQWPSAEPRDTWASTLVRATHVVFLGDSERDPLAALADRDTANARVRDVEHLLSDTRGRCLVGRASGFAASPEYQLDRARIAVAIPEGADVIGRSVGSRRTLDIEAEAVLAPAPSPAVVDAWIAEGRTWVGSALTEVRGELGMSDPLAAIIVDVAAAVAYSAFRHELAGDTLRMSWRSDRITEREIEAFVPRFRRAGL
jgi:hypothetical protein